MPSRGLDTDPNIEEAVGLDYNHDSDGDGEGDGDDGEDDLLKRLFCGQMQM